MSLSAQDLLKIIGFYGRFTPTYSRLGYVARSLRWPRRQRDFSGQRWLVTGASGGIGAAIVAGAVSAGAEVIAVARSEEKLAALRDALPPQHRERLRIEQTDLSSVASIDALLERLAAGAPIDVLANNVGVLLNEHSLSPEGCETSYVTNLLGHYQLTEGLLAGTLMGPQPLLLNMSSGGLYNLPLGLAFLNLTDRNQYAGKATYAAHKRAQVALSKHWDERLKSSGGRSYVMHPGWARTEGVRQSLPLFYRIQGAILRSAAEGADTALWLAQERPADGGDAIWFDRAVRPQHIFAHTREPQCTVQELLDYLKADLQHLQS